MISKEPLFTPIYAHFANYTTFGGMGVNGETGVNGEMGVNGKTGKIGRNGHNWRKWAKNGVNNGSLDSIGVAPLRDWEKMQPRLRKEPILHLGAFKTKFPFF